MLNSLYHIFVDSYRLSCGGQALVLQRRITVFLHEERVLLGYMVEKNCFGVEQFPFFDTNKFVCYICGFVINLK